MTPSLLALLQIKNHKQLQTQNVEPKSYLLRHLMQMNFLVCCGGGGGDGSVSTIASVLLLSLGGGGGGDDILLGPSGDTDISDVVSAAAEELW